MKKSLFLIFTTVLLSVLVACASYSSTPNPTNNEAKNNTIVSNTPIVIPSSVIVSTETHIPITTDILITNDDKALVVRMTLESVRFGDNKPDYEILADKPIIVLSTQNLNRNWALQIDDLNIIMLDPKEIQDKVIREGDYLYWRFQTIEIKDDGKIIVSVDNIWAKRNMVESGFTIEYHRENGIWNGEIKSMWIS